MNDSTRLSGPQRLLLATNLSAGCDHPLVREHDIELAVSGLHSPAGLVRVLMGSRGERLLRDLMCDTLVVRAEKRDGDA